MRLWKLSKKGAACILYLDQTSVSLKILDKIVISKRDFALGSLTARVKLVDFYNGQLIINLLFHII